MAVATVFVDDVVFGRVPSVCVKSGVPADRWVADRADVGRLGATWVLLFFGPPGWVIFVLLALFDRERLRVVLPYSNQVVDSIRRLRRLRNGLAAASGVVLVAFAVPLSSGSMASDAAGSLGLVLVVASMLAALAVQTRLEQYRIGVSLDASRRWVTLRGVSETFAEHVRAAQVRAAQHPSPAVSTDR
jgi:hypothetical protein